MSSRQNVRSSVRQRKLAPCSRADGRAFSFAQSGFAFTQRHSLLRKVIAWKS